MMFKNGLGLFVSNYINDDGKLLYDTLVYSRKDGFSFVVLSDADGYADNSHSWQGYYSSLPQALEEARKAGLDPKACQVIDQ